MIELYIQSVKIDIKHRTFGGGEPHLYVAEFPHRKDDEVIIKLKFQSSEDIMNLLLLNNVVENIYRGKNFHKMLWCEYLPFSRQDRITSINEPFSLKVITDLINSLKFDEVVTIDNHSDVAEALLWNNRNVPQYEATTGNVKLLTFSYDTICAPDAGAIKKVTKFRKELNPQATLVTANKVRDLITGEITGTEIWGDVNDKKVLIVDDICDGGRTFIELAKVLYEAGAKEVGLLVTHGIFSRGVEPLQEAGIKDIMTLNDLRKQDVSN